MCAITILIALAPNGSNRASRSQIIFLVFLQLPLGGAIAEVCFSTKKSSEVPLAVVWVSTSGRLFCCADAALLLRARFGPESSLRDFISRPLLKIHRHMASTSADRDTAVRCSAWAYSLAVHSSTCSLSSPSRCKSEYCMEAGVVR